MQTSPFDILIEELRAHPEEFDYDTRSKFTLVHERSEVEVWIGNGFFFYGIYRPQEVPFTLLQKCIFWMEFRKWRRGYHKVVIQNKKLEVAKTLIMSFGHREEDERRRDVASGQRRKSLVLDFDGVLHSYTSGWKGVGNIPDGPVPGAMEFLVSAVNHFNVYIHSARNNHVDGIMAMRSWLRGNLEEAFGPREAERVVGLLRFETGKPPCDVMLDDRALTFSGTWPSIEELEAFQPWTKKTSANT